MSESSIVDELGRYPTATLYEASGRQGAMDVKIKPLTAGSRVAGVAYTVRCAPYDNLALHRALAEAPAGVVLVIDTTQGHAGTYCGEILVLAAKTRGAAGIVLDGHVRDARDIRALDFPVFCHGSVVRGAHKKEEGELQVPVTCGNVRVAPGDIVVADDDGVMVIAADRAEAVLAGARKRDEWEQYMVRGVKEGKTTLELLAGKGSGS